MEPSGKYEENLVDLYMRYVNHTESPESYHKWCAFSMLASVLGRKVWLDWNMFQVFCNMFVVLVGPPGKCRKSAAIRYATDLLKECEEINLVSEAITREALIRLMANSTKSFVIDPTLPADMEGNVGWHSSVSIISSEFSVFLGHHNYAMLAFLCDIYDCHDSWEYKTKGQGEDTILGVWVSILAGTTPEWLTSSMPQEAIGGGLTSRMMMVVEHNKRKKVAKPTCDPLIKGELITRLQEINTTYQGELTLTTEADTFFVKWYEGQPEATTEFGERVHMYVLKVALLLAVGAGRRQVNVIDLRRAIHEIGLVEPGMTRTLRGAGRSPLSYAINLLQSALEDNEFVSIPEFLSEHRRDVSPEEVDGAVKMLSVIGVCRFDPIKQGLIRTGSSS